MPESVVETPMVPAVVMGELVTVNPDGIVKPTDVTEPPPPAPGHAWKLGFDTVPLEIRHQPLVPGAIKLGALTPEPTKMEWFVCGAIDTVTLPTVPPPVRPPPAVTPVIVPAPPPAVMSVNSEVLRDHK
jgi:hypothetical protein